MRHFSFEEQFIKKVENKTAMVGIVGLGYVGLPLILSFVEAGFNVLGFDIDKSKIKRLQNRETYIAHIKPERIANAVESGRLQVSCDFSLSSQADALIICVPTPLTKYREPDISFVTGTLTSLLPHLREGQLLSLESTTFPGTTEEVLRPPIESRGFQIGENFFLVYSPEREDPGNKKFETKSTPKVIGGSTGACARAGLALYRQVISEMVPVSSTQAAELVKLLENIYRAVNIGLVNEMKIVTDRMGLDIFEIINAAATKPFGFTPFYPGPGIGGHCIPVDPFYLTWKARAYDVNTRFIELAGEINRGMPYWVSDKIIQALNERGKALNGAKVLVLGIAYKKNVDDMRESPSVEVMKILAERGAVLNYCDPHVPVFPSLRRGRFDLASVELNEDTLKNSDAVVLLTDHCAFDHDFILRHAPLIIDTRGAFPDDAKVVRA